MLCTFRPSGLTFLQECLELLKDSTDLFLLYLRQSENLLEGARHIVLSASDEDARYGLVNGTARACRIDCDEHIPSSDDDLLRLALQDLALVHELEDVLGGVGHSSTGVDAIRQ